MCCQLMYSFSDDYNCIIINDNFCDWHSSYDGHVRARYGPTGESFIVHTPPNGQAWMLDASTHTHTHLYNKHARAYIT